MTQVCRQIRNESNKPGFERKHKFRKAGRTAGSSVTAESTEEQKMGAESPAKTLSGTFRAGSFCAACQHMDLANINFPSLSKFFLDSPFYKSSPISSMTPIITLPSLALNSHHCSSSSLVPYFSWILLLLSQSQLPCLYLLVIILVSALQT